MLILTEYNEELHQKTLYNEGYEDGEKQGWKSGEEHGRKIGEEHGQRLASARINTFNQHLIQLNRLEDLKKAAEDTHFQQKLLEEFGL